MIRPAIRLNRQEQEEAGLDGQFVAFDQAVAQMHAAPRVARDVGLVGDENDGVAGADRSFSNSGMISSPVLESRLPVGSSARMIDGSLTRARAIATRWRWPPESSLGLWWHAIAESDVMQALARPAPRRSSGSIPA